MCTHVPGECLAVAQLSHDELEHRLSAWDLPGRWTILPLVTGSGTWPQAPEDLFGQHHFVHFVDIPDGLEMLAVSKLSACLHDLIGAHRAVVELHHQLPLGAQSPRPPPAELGPRGRRHAAQLRQALESMGNPAPRPVALLDTGLSVGGLRVRARQRTARDYAFDRAPDFGAELAGNHDLIGHGTQVFRILDEALPDRVPIVSGRVAAHNELGITVLRVASAFAHLVAMHDPAVVNLSLAPRDDLLTCPHCRRPVAVGAFHSLLLAHVFRIVAPRTQVVMAAGNRGQVGNARHGVAAADNLILVEAADSTGELASYSNSVDEEFVAAARVFGGDDDSTPRGQSVFRGQPHSRGTSFAAPFVTVAAYAWQLRHGGLPAHPAPGMPAFGSFCGDTLGIPIEYRGVPRR